VRPDERNHVLTTASESHYDFYWGERWSHRGLWRSVLFSACLHVAVILFLPSARYRPKIIEFPPLYEVRFVELEPARPTPPRRPPERRTVEPEKKAPKVVTPPVEPEKKPEVKPRKVVKTTVEKEKKEQEPVRPPPQPAKVETVAKIESDLPQWYRDAIEDTVRRHWDEPLVNVDVAFETVICFSIIRSGAVTSPRIEKQSGDKRWDLAALRAVMESRFAPLPPECKDPTVIVHLSFKHEGKEPTQ